jgi:hypothetical protein
MIMMNIYSIHSPDHDIVYLIDDEDDDMMMTMMTMMMTFNQYLQFHKTHVIKRQHD